MSTTDPPPTGGPGVRSRLGLIGLAGGPLLAGVVLPYVMAADDAALSAGRIPAYVFAPGAATLWWSARRPAGRAAVAAWAGAAVLVALGLATGWASGLDDAVRPLVPLLAGAAAGCAAGGTLVPARTSRRDLTVWSAATAASTFLLARPLHPGDPVLALGPAVLIALGAAVLALVAARSHARESDGVEAAGAPQPGERAAFGLVVLAVFGLGAFAAQGGLYAAAPVVTLAMLCGLGVAAILIGIAPDRRGAVYAAAAAPAVVALGWGGVESAMRLSGGSLAVIIGVVSVLAGTVIAVRLPERPRNLAVAGSMLVGLAAAWWVWQPGWAGPEAYLAGAGLGGGLLLGTLLRLRRPLAVGVLALAVCAAPIGGLAAGTLGGGPTPPGSHTLGTPQPGSAGSSSAVPGSGGAGSAVPGSAGPGSGGPGSAGPGSGGPGSAGFGFGETRAELVPGDGAGGGVDGDVGGDSGSGDAGGTAAPRLGEERPLHGAGPSRATGEAPVECDAYESQNGEYVCISELPDQARNAVVLRAERPASATAVRPTGLLVTLALLAAGTTIALLRRPTPNPTPTDPN